MTPHIKYLVWYLVTSSNSVPCRLKGLVDAILFFSEEIFGQDNITSLGTRIIINTPMGKITIQRDTDLEF